MAEFQNHHEKSRFREVLQYWSGGSGETTASCPSPTFGPLQHSPLSHSEASLHIKTTLGDLQSSSSFLPNDSLRIKYLEQREKLWKQLTADYRDSCIEDGGVENVKSLQSQLSPVTSQPLGNRFPTTNHDPGAEAKLLPEEVAFNSSRSNYVLPAPTRPKVSNIQNIATRQEYHHIASGNIRPCNASITTGYSSNKPCSESATLDDLKHRLENTSPRHSEKKPKKKRRTHSKSRCKKSDSGPEELNKENKRKGGHYIDIVPEEQRTPFKICGSIMPNVPSLTEEGGISRHNRNDVLCGKGSFAFSHPGNIYYRKLVSKYKLDYVVGNSCQKLAIAKNIVKDIRSLVPPGRFLKKIVILNGKSSYKVAWQDVGEEAMMQKTRQALRLGANRIKDHQRGYVMQVTRTRAFTNGQKAINEGPASAPPLSHHLCWYRH